MRHGRPTRSVTLVFGLITGVRVLGGADRLEFLQASAALSAGEQAGLAP
jgi:hypothetical protein